MNSTSSSVSSQHPFSDTGDAYLIKLVSKCSGDQSASY